MRMCYQTVAESLTFLSIPYNSDVRMRLVGVGLGLFTVFGVGWRAVWRLGPGMVIANFLGVWGFGRLTRAGIIIVAILLWQRVDL